LAHVVSVLSGGEQEARKVFLAGLPKEIGRMMKEKEGEVKEEEKRGKGLSGAGIVGRRECFVL
jgi:hypothetical protein